VALAVRGLVEKFGYQISYEDPRYAYTEDLEDVTERVRKVSPESAGRKPARVMVPRSGRFTVNFQSARGPESVISDALSAASSAGARQRFTMRKLDSMIEVVPASARDRNGNEAHQESVLDVQISLAAERRTAYETLRALCAAISAVAGVKVELGMTGFEPAGLDNPDESQFLVGADDEPARVVLKRALDAIAVRRGRFTWMLLYGNQDTDDAYALNLLQVPNVEKARFAPAAVPAIKQPVGESPTNDGNVVPLPKI
jgi:hypothetical protein